MKPRPSTLTVANDVALVPVVTTFVREIAATCGFDEGDRHKIALCVEEAAANVIDHAFSADEDATYEVVCTPRTTGLEIAVRDRGLPFDPERIRPYDPSASLDERGDCGLGIFLMRRLMDHVTFRNLGKDGKETVLFRFFPGLHIEQMESDHDLSPWPAPKAEVARRENATFSLRLMRAEEAVEVSRAVYRAYGYSYVYENIYFPDRIRALNASGEMTSALALSDEDGTMAGHVALFSSPASRSLVEIGMAVVKPEFRGYGLSNRLFAFLLDEARSRGFDGVFAHCVTNHELTQRVCLKLGFVDCALQVGFAPSTLSFKGITDVLAQRESVVVSHLTLSKPPPATLFSPPRHAEMLTRIYEALDLDVTWAPAPDDCPAEDGEPTTHLSNGLGFAQIAVRAIGADTATKIHALLRSLCQRHFEVVHVLLDLENPRTPALVEALEAQGFFFSGPQPNAMTAHTLVLQYLNNVAIDYDRIVLITPVGRAIGDYVRGVDPSTRAALASP